MIKQSVVPAILVAVYLLLALPVTERQGVNWDEQTDLDIAAEYTASRGGPMYGSRIDAVNMRLPMYSIAMLDAVTPVDPLRLARWVSVLLGAATLLLTCRVATTWTDRHKAWATGAILATSPYFIYFSSVALSEGDIWITATTALFLVAATACVAWNGCNAGVAAVGVTLGLALSAKISALALLPVAVLVVAAPWCFSRAATPATSTQPVSRRLPLAVGLAFVPWLAYTAAVARVVDWPLGAWLPSVLRHPATRWIAAATMLAALLLWCVRHRGGSLRPLESAPLTLLIGALTFFVVPPVHTTNPYVLESLWREMFAAGGGIAWAFVAEAGAFHALVLLLKPGLAVGAALLVGLVVAAVRARNRPELRLGLLVLLCYAAFLALLPWAQARYAMPVFPVLAFFAADMLVDAARRRPRWVVGFVVLAAALLARDYVLTYPDLNLNGYQWTGARYLAGRSTLGYRGIGTTPSDGVQQALAWTCDRAGPEHTVLTFLGEEHILRATCDGFGFRRVNGLRQPFDLGEADYVVTTINTDVDAGHFTDNPEGEVFKYPYYDRARLEREFKREFSVRRAFDIEVAAVWTPKAAP